MPREPKTFIDAPCSCGSEAFEQVVVQRVFGKEYWTEFIACMGCGLMYWRPERKPPPEALSPEDEAERRRRYGIGPPLDYS